jgi:3-oxoacyl-[acyl-carrier-protein] synthase III
MLYLHAMGHFRPDGEIDNQFLEELGIDTTNQWILDRVGIRSRRTVLSLDYISQTHNANPSEAWKHSLYTNAQTGSAAARQALENAGLQASDIGMVVSGSCSPQFTTPAEACTIAASLGIQGPAFDLNSACSSFGAQMHFIASMNPAALPDYVLVVNPENNTRAIDYRDRSTAVLWGDASSAAIVSARIPAPMRLVHTMTGSDPSGHEKVKIAPFQHFHQDGSAVQGFAVRRACKLLNELRAMAKGKAEDVYFIGHQANLRMLESVVARCDVPTERHLYNVDRFGNCGAAGAPSVLSENWKKFVPGDEIALTVVGAGLSWAGLLLRMES